MYYPQAVEYNFNRREYPLVVGDVRDAIGQRHRSATLLSVSPNSREVNEPPNRRHSN